MRDWSAARFRRASALDGLALVVLVLVVLVVFLDEPHVLPRTIEALNLSPLMLPLFRERVRELPLIASILRALATGAPVSRERVLAGLRPQVAPPEAERQVDTAVDWGRWAELFDYDADDACFRRVGEAGS